MSEAYLHLVLNHVPVMSILIGVFGLSYGIGFKKHEVVNASLVLMAFASIATIPVYITGDESEAILKVLGSWSEQRDQAVHEHEELAEIALILNLFLGMLSMFALLAVQKGASLANKLKVATFIVSIIAFAVLVQVALKGGKISHEAELVPLKHKTGNP